MKLVVGQYEITGDGGLASSCRLEIDSDGHAHRPDGAQLHALLGYGIAARNVELVDTAVSLTFDADDLVELSHIKINSRRGRRRGCDRKRSLALGQRVPDSSCDLHRVAVTGHVHVECRRVRPEKVMVNSCNLQTA